MIYLDNASTTMLDPLVLEEMMPYLTEDYGNPSSSHNFGHQAKTAIEQARARVAKAINAKPSQIVFTSGATESNNWLGVNYSLFAANSEHPSIQKNVSTTPSKAENNVISRMMVNNETGLICEIKRFTATTHSNYVNKFPKFFVHTDATQAFGHVPIDVQDIDVDFLTLSAHKFHGPKGIGILYVKEPDTIKPLMYGGGQEHGLRSGTENVPAIVGMGKAAELHKYSESIDKQLKEYKNIFINGLMNFYSSEYSTDKISVFNTSEYVPNIITVVFKGLQGENIVDALDYYGICCSTGSACHNNDKLSYGYSYTDIGIDKRDLNSVVRFSTSVFNTTEEIYETIKTLKEIIRKQVVFSEQIQ